MKAAGWILLILAAGAATYYIWPRSPKTINFATQTFTDGAVEYTVTPKKLTPEAEFEIRLNTHSGSLDQDLTQIALLADSLGHKYPAVAWAGDPPGGHHRSGALKFASVTSRSSDVELIIGGNRLRWTR